MSKQVSETIIGCSVYSKDFVGTAELVNNLGGNFCQIFLSSPQSYIAPRHSDQELSALKQQLLKYNIGIVIHGSFMLNFCNDQASSTHTKAVDLLVKDLNDSVKLGAIGVIIHMGKRLEMEEKTAIDNYVIGIKSVLKKSNQKSIVILETGAGCGSEVCTKISELGNLYDKFTKEEKERIKFCIDTCHVYSAGYDLSNDHYIKIFDMMIDSHLSWDKVVCIHLNDSKCKLDSRKDRHADLTTGYIKTDGLKKFVQLCHKKNIPMILETPCDTELCFKKQIDIVKDWIK